MDKKESMTEAVVVNSKEGMHKLGKSLEAYAVVGDTVVMRVLGYFGINGRAFASALYISLPSALIALLLRYLASNNYLRYYDENNTKYFLDIPHVVWTSITGVLGFLVVFRAQQAYGRYWQALTSVHLMRAEWFESCSALTSFCTTSQDAAAIERVRHFKNLIVRLFSLCHAGALMKLIESENNTEAAMCDFAVEAGKIPVIDPACLDSQSIKAFQETDMKVEIVSQWIQHLIVKGLDEKVIAVPPPIATRSFQELANGIVKYHDAVKVKMIPFPKYYQEVCDILLVIHWLMTPALTALWVNSVPLSFIFTLLAVFTMWSLTLVSRNIENPFCRKVFFSDSVAMQMEFNHQLLLMLDPRCTRIPKLAGMQSADLAKATFEQVPLSDFMDAGHESCDKHLFTGSWHPVPPSPVHVNVQHIRTAVSEALAESLPSVPSNLVRGPNSPNTGPLPTSIHGVQNERSGNVPALPSRSEAREIASNIQDGQHCQLQAKDAVADPERRGAMPL